MSDFYKIRKTLKYTGNKPISNIDYWYGPWNSIEEVCEEIPLEMRGIGLTVGIVKNNKITEYLWKEGISDEYLVEKIEKIDLTINRIGNHLILIEEGNSILFSFNVSGRASISRTLLYMYSNGQETFLKDFTNTIKGQNTITIDPPSVSGIYTYHIKVVDTAGYSAKSEETEEEYIEYVVQYGGISILLNTSNFNRIKIKNVLSLATLYFTININVRDNTFIVQDVLLYENDNLNYISLSPYKSLSEINNTYLGFNYYILPNENSLQPFNGKNCYVKIIYTQDGEEKNETKELFTLLDIESLNFVSVSSFETYYLNFLSLYKFELQSGIENVNIYVTKGEDSDFNFDPVTVSAYNTYSLRIKPNVIKQNAILSIDCTYYINNQQIQTNFKYIIGNIVELPNRAYHIPPIGSSVNLDELIISDENDFVEGEKYYKIIENPGINGTYHTCAFIADFYCKIPLNNNKELKYIRILQGNSEIGYITEEQINCRDITTDTPLNEWVQIGFGYNLEETIVRNNLEQNSKYFAIYLNGMIVKNQIIASGKAIKLTYSQENPIRIELSNGIIVSKALIYYSDSNTQYINPLSEIYSIIYKNYMAHLPNWNEPENLPVLKFWRITDDTERLYYFNLLKLKNSDIKHLTLFGNIGDPKALSNMTEYDPSYDNNIPDHNDAKLFRLSVNIKKPALKEYCVLCRGLYGNTNILNDCIIEVHTQGTSTLVYPIPNFKFTFWKEINGELEYFSPEFILDSNGSYYNEHVYTAKADFMDSSHLNNTPTCNFYNNLIHNLIEDNVSFSDFEGSPSARKGNLDAIVGFPIIMEISDYSQDENGDFMNIGSFMLNVDKTGESLGFEIIEDQQTTLSCISFEGTSNDNTHGASGRFDKEDNELLYYDTEEEIDSDYNEINTALVNSGKKLDLDSTINGTKVSNRKYVKWCNFLSNGLEYRYPDSDIYKESGNNLTKVMKLSDFKKLYRMWEWVSKSDSYTEEKYRNEFENYFDLDYCILYFIQLMIFAQTDNLGKNAMFDCWDGEHWYPRPYDLDSQAGLDNNGNDNIAPFVEIKPEFSLNYNSSYTREQLEEEYLIQDENGNVSKILYNGQEYDRYHFSSNKSKLWINFYKNYKNLINGFYRRLRTNGNYSASSIINLCETQLISKLGVNQYNKDFLNKYLATEYLDLALGNRWYKFKKWLIQRFAFCDSYFGMGDTALYGLVSLMPEYRLEMQFPQYVQLSYLDSNAKPYFVVGERIMPGAGSGAATKFTLVLALNLVLNSGHFKYVFLESGPTNFENLIKLDVSGNKQITNITNLTGNNLSNLKELNISDSSVNTLSTGIPQSLKKLVARNVSINTIVFPNNCLVEEIDLNGSQISENIYFSNLPNLKKLILTNCTFNGNIQLEELPNLQEFKFNNTLFNGNIVISNNVAIDEFNFSKIRLNQVLFDGNSINIKKLNFIETVFSYNTINIDAISNNIEELYFNGCLGLEHIEMNTNIFFESLTTFSIDKSSIKSIGTNREFFDASKFNNLPNKMNSLNRVTAYLNDGTPTTFGQFIFNNTKIVKISNIDWEGSGLELFRDCYDLVEITGKLNLKNNIDRMFYLCSALTTIPSSNNIIIDNDVDPVTSAIRTFECNHSIGYSNIESIIIKCEQVISFEGCCEAINYNNYSGNDYIQINLDTLFENNTVVENLNWMFGAGGYPGHSAGQLNKLKILGNIPSSVKYMDYMFYGYESNNNKTTLNIFYNILEKASNLESMEGTFFRINGEFYYPVEDELPSTNKINNTFFYTDESTGENTTLKNLSGTFERSNIEPSNNLLFSNLKALEYCISCFRSGSNKSFSTSLLLDSMWVFNPNLKDISGCFLNITNVYCNNTLGFHNNVTNINISGLMGIDTNGKNGSLMITIDINSIFNNGSRNVTFDDYHRIMANSAFENRGVFEGRKVKIMDSPSNDESKHIFSRLSSNCRRLFFGSDLYFVYNTSDTTANVKTINLTNVKHCKLMFYNCSAYKFNSNGTYNDNNRLMFNFILPTTCSYYDSMFNYSKILLSLPNLNSSSVVSTTYMYSNCVINLSEVIISSNYFLICKSRITNTSYMFSNNKYITELLYSNACGLFQGCTNLSNLKHMFEGCHYLYRGIPVNLFGTTNLTKITSLENLFANTSILRDILDGSNKWIDNNTFGPLINLEDLSGLFMNNRVAYAQGGYVEANYREQVRKLNTLESDLVYIIDPDTFTAMTHLTTIRYMFKNTDVVRQIPLKFNRFEYAEEAFYGSAIRQIGTPFINEVNLPFINNVSRMFYTPSTTGFELKSSITNLSSFVDKLVELGTVTMDGVAYGIDDMNIYGSPITSQLANETACSWINVSGNTNPVYPI